MITISQKTEHITKYAEVIWFAIASCIWPCNGGNKNKSDNEKTVYLSVASAHVVHHLLLAPRIAPYSWYGTADALVILQADFMVELTFKSTKFSQNGVQFNILTVCKL